MTTTQIDTRLAWRVTLAEQQVRPAKVTAHSLRVVDGCLEFTRDGIVVRAFARGAWLDANLDES